MQMSPHVTSRACAVKRSSSYIFLALLLSAAGTTAFTRNAKINGRTVGGSIVTSLNVGDNGVLGFVKGLDSALGNPTAYSAAEVAATTSTSASASSGAMDMSVPNSMVLVAGGGLAFVAVSALAASVLLSQKEEEEEQGSNNNQNQNNNNSLNTSFGVEDVTVLDSVQTPPKTDNDDTDDDESWANDVNDALLATESALRKEVESKQKETKSKLDEATVVIEKLTSENGTLVADNGKLAEEMESTGGILATLKAKLTRKTEELENSIELLSTETDLRKETESKLTNAVTDNEKLTETLTSKEKALVETTEKWNYTKTRLEMETEQKETLTNELKNVAETNRVLEDKYELEQNALRKAQTVLDSTTSDLESTQKRLVRTQGELTRYHSELQETKSTLWKTSLELENLEDEQKSVRTLGGKMWQLSKQKVSNRIQAVGDRIRNPRRRKAKKKN